MSVIASVRAFIQDYPGLSTFDDLVGVEHLPEDTKSYAIEASVTSQPIKKRYINGDTERRFNFVLASREYFGADVAEYRCGGVLRRFLRLVGTMYDQ